MDRAIDPNDWKDYIETLLGRLNGSAIDPNDRKDYIETLLGRLKGSVNRSREPQLITLVSTHEFNSEDD